MQDLTTFYHSFVIRQILNRICSRADSARREVCNLETQDKIQWGEGMSSVKHVTKNVEEQKIGKTFLSSLYKQKSM